MGNESSSYADGGSPPRPLSGRSRPLKSLSVDEACALLISLNVRDVSLFEENKVDGADLAEATEDDLEALGIDLKMKRTKLVKKLADLMWSGVPVELIGEDDLTVEYSPATLFGTPPRGSPSKSSDFGSGGGFQFDPFNGIGELFGGSPSPRKKRTPKKRSDERDGYILEDFASKLGMRLEEIMGPSDTVDLAGKELTVEDMPAIEAMLATNEGVRSLFLDMNNLGDAGVIKLVELLPLRPELQELYLSANNIGDKGAKELAGWVRDSENCTTIALSENKIGDSGAVELAKAVCQYDNVQKIALDANDVGDKGVKSFAKQLKNNSTLQMLDLSPNPRIGPNAKEQLELVWATHECRGMLADPRNLVL